MIVRTYARRNRCITRSYSETSFNGGSEGTFQDSLSQETSQDVFSFGFSSQDSSTWSLDSDIYGSSSIREPESQSSLPPRPLGAPNSLQGNKIQKSKKSRKASREPGPLKKPNSGGSKVARTLSAPPTSTLMEAQEFGEMMEHMDEVNFALDGLRPGQPYRVRRASLLSLLSISMTAQQRRLLRAQGMAKTIIDAILGLSFDDSPSILAAAALFFALSSDGQDDNLLDSPACIHFLLKLLKPPTADSIDDKSANIGGKLLSVSRDIGSLKGMTKRLDSSSSAVISKVQEILLSCKEIRPLNEDNDIERPELNPKWIALLTLEKACLSTVSLEDTSGTVRKIGGNFKEKFRELGGLEAVFGMAVDCHTTLEAQLNNVSASSRDLRDDAAFQSCVLLLKCLKIMVNATFPSKDNQNHLLEMRAKLGSEGPPLSFVGLVISAINILSGLSMLQSSCCISTDEKSASVSNGVNGQFYVSNAKAKLCDIGKVDEILSNDFVGNCCSIEASSSQIFSKVSHKRQRMSTSRLEISSCSETSSMFSPNVPAVTKGTDPLACMSNGFLKGLNGANSISDGSRVDSFGLGERNHDPVENKLVNLEDSQDPFAFDENDMEPSKWDLLSLKTNSSRTKKSKRLGPTLNHASELRLRNEKQESSADRNISSFENSTTSATKAEYSSLLVDCLLTAVKVLVNLTNDNSIGCQQIARCGGLDTMATLIIHHFPMFDSGPSILRATISDHLETKHMCDQELDFLVAILGLLVNLVEKDAQNRSRLATASVQLPRSGRMNGEAEERDVISLLCTIFLANQGAGEAAGDEELLPWNDEAAVLQGEREAEKMIIEAYAALLLAFLSTESSKVRDAIANYLPDHNLEVLVPVLERFVAFHLTLNMISPETHAAVTKVIESCRGP
ncbi:hypothetical protein H6P81_016853 [Aristolochia fimbriata]|uniref:Wings apart-like protein C-terminal domain-containing protein n=1 Tax=Aristolochia fimbriata TaxID=158543 RepID=A0AAV7DXJ3_ARIFI|nr:hypothetical protein H6P81_016853 [Aristolochia fimbriata]